MADDMKQIDPKALTPSTIIRWRTSTPQVLDHRKADDSGWWLTDGSGLADSAWESGDWCVVGETHRA